MKHIIKWLQRAFNNRSKIVTVMYNDQQINTLIFKQVQTPLIYIRKAGEDNHPLIIERKYVSEYDMILHNKNITSVMNSQKNTSKGHKKNELPGYDMSGREDYP